MNKDNNGFLKLIGVIIVLLLVIIIGLLSMPRMEEAREKAFRIEATRIIDSSKLLLKNYNGKKYVLKNNYLSCRKDNEICFNIEELKNTNLYKSGSDDYVGKVVIDLSDSSNQQFYLYLKKSYDLKIIAGFREDYVTMGTLSIEEWKEDYETCNCE